MKDDSTGSGGHGLDRLVDFILEHVEGGEEYKLVRERVAEDVHWLIDNPIGAGGMFAYVEMLTKAVHDTALGVMQDYYDAASGDAGKLAQMIADKYAEREEK